MSTGRNLLSFRKILMLSSTGPSIPKDWKLQPNSERTLNITQVKFSLRFIKHPATTMYGAVEVRVHALVTSVLVGDKESPSSPGQGIPGTDWVRGRSLPDATRRVRKVKIQRS